MTDTNAAIAVFNESPEIRAVLKPGMKVVVPVVVLGELYGGAANSARPEENLLRVVEFVRDSEVVICTDETARRYGEIYAQLRKIGRRIPQNDMWIAALAMQHSLTLLTRDAHFQAVSGLQALGW
jgi:tRNA(fMet)-specific endonuclease VapC